MLIYNMNLILCCCLVYTPFMLYSFILMNFYRINHDKTKKVWGIFFKEFEVGQSKWAAMYYVLYFIRRLIISISLVLFDKYALFQVTICVLSCFGVIYIKIFLYLVIFRPYETKLQNIIQILNELSISIAYSACALFYWDSGLDLFIHAWVILTFMFFSYALHLGVISILILKYIGFC